MNRRAGIHDLEGAVPGADEDFDAELRERSDAASAALDAFLHPHPIAVVGASSDSNTIAGLLFANLVNSHFAGVVLPVNRKHPTVQGIAAYADLASCPVVPDLVFVCVPAVAVPGVVAQAGVLGVKAVCVISAGFAETGRDGALLEADLLREALAHGVRLVGPNCTGILSGTGDSRFNATFSRSVPPPGRASLLSQSGAIGLAVLEGLQPASGSGRSYRSATAPTLPVTSCSCIGDRIPHRLDHALPGGTPDPSGSSASPDGSPGVRRSWPSRQGVRLVTHRAMRMNH